MSRETTLAKNTIIMSIGTILPKLSMLITLPIITAKLTQAEYGTYDLISTLVSLFLPVATLQVQSAAFRFLIDCNDDKTKRNRVITNEEKNADNVYSCPCYCGGNFRVCPEKSGT